MTKNENELLEASDELTKRINQEYNALRAPLDLKERILNRKFSRSTPWIIFPSTILASASLLVMAFLIYPQHKLNKIEAADSPALSSLQHEKITKWTNDPLIESEDPLQDLELIDEVVWNS